MIIQITLHHIILHHINLYMHKNSFIKSLMHIIPITIAISIEITHTKATHMRPSCLLQVYINSSDNILFFLMKVGSFIQIQESNWLHWPLKRYLLSLFEIQPHSNSICQTKKQITEADRNQFNKKRELTQIRCEKKIVIWELFSMISSMHTLIWRMRKITMVSHLFISNGW